MTVGLIFIASICLALSGLPALLGGAKSNVGTVLSAALNVLAAALAAAGIVAFLRDPAAAATLNLPWALPWGHFAIGLDALSVFFLIPIFLISALGSFYGLGYWPQNRHPGNGRRLRACWGLLAAAMVLIVLARHAVVFLMAWEIMALSAFLLVATEDYKPQVRQAAWVYLVATHVGTLCLFGFFALLAATTGTFDLWPTLDSSAGAPLTALLILALVGFGMKAGLFPLHVWLPGAHANAPSHVSAVLSGVMLKMGVYGLFRVTGLVAQPPIWWGAVVLALGTVSALLGIAFAVGQQDYKRLLAYSSIENIGIITMGLGLALLGRASGHQEWVILGTAAALLHVLNHSLFKPLLFLGAGSLVHAVHTRNMDRLGGLAKRMPLTYGIFLLGGIAICGLPPLNGFVSELLLYLGLLKTTQTPAAPAWAWAALAAPALAAVGALAVSGFVKLIGSVFQGTPRRTSRVHAHDPGFTMAAPLILLAALCVTVGIFPILVRPLLEPAIGAWTGGPASGSAWLPWNWQLWAGIVLAAGCAAALIGLTLLSKTRTAPRPGTWDCGYARPTPRMQYTATSLGQFLVDMLAWALWPRRVHLRLKHLFPHPRLFTRDVPDAVLDRVLTPAFGAGRGAALRLRGIQQGSVQAYLVYLLVIIVILVLLG